jgi:hypothetical protein
MREDFVLNHQSKKLVLVSMATDKMIRLVAMYPDVWFMETTANKLFTLSIFIRTLLLNEFNYYFNSTTCFLHHSFPPSFTITVNSFVL